MGTGRVQADGPGTPCPGSYSHEWSPRVLCTLQTVTQGPLLLQLWKGKSSPSKGCLVWNGCDSGQCPLRVLITVGEVPVILCERAGGVKPAQRDVSGTQGTLPPPAEVEFGHTRGAGAVCTSSFWTAADPVREEGQGHPACHSTKTYQPHRARAAGG